MDKNTTEMALVIDAMDILHEGKIDCFYIAASDGDCRIPARRIRVAGLTVPGYGKGKTPEVPIASCRECRYAGQQQGVEPELMPKYRIKRYGRKTLGELYEQFDRYELVKTEKGVAGMVRRK